jgi:hypothetical protein
MKRHLAYVNYFWSSAWDYWWIDRLQSSALEFDH